MSLVPVTLYLHNFNTAATISPYTVLPTATTGTPTGILNSLFTNVTSWVSSDGSFTNFGGNSGQSLVITPINGATSSMTLTLNVKDGYQATLNSFNFWRQKSTNGANISSITINGNQVLGANSSPTSGSFIGSTSVSNANNLTGTVKVVINLTAPVGASQNFRLDEFTLSGNITCLQPTAYTVTGGGAVCSGTGVPVGLSNSQLGINYQLQIDGVDSGSAVSGTGAAISFGNQNTVGTYTVIAKNTNGTCNLSTTMTGSVTIVTNISTTWKITSPATTPAWDNGAPNSATYQMTATIEADYAEAADIIACSLSVTNNANVTIPTGNNVTLNGALNVGTGSSFTLETDANLVQKTQATNTGSITVKRDITIKDGKQYNYLISPTGSGLKTDLYGPGNSAQFTLYHNEANNIFSNSSGAYIKGRGLAVKEPITGSGTVNALFKGVPMNEAFTYNLANSNVGTGTTLGYNLTGNPYPSNIDLDKLYNLGSNKANISPTFYFWDNTVNAATSQGGTGYSGAAYALFNAAAGSAGTGTAAGSLSGSVNGNKIPTRVVKTGQAFMVQSIEKVNKTLYFDNSIRTADAGIGFFGNASKGTVTASADDRFWLNLAAPSSISTQIAVVYFDGGVDAFAIDDSKLNGLPSDVLYSVIGDQKAVINGRASFVNTDSIPLGSNSFTAGTFTFSLGNKEGKFANGQNIYLKDKQTGIVTNLSAGNYTFQANSGESTGRFEIIYQPETVLATDTKVKENLIVYKDGNDFVVKAQNKKISSLEVFDSAGRLIWALKPESIKAIIPAEKINNGLYVLKINQNGEITSKKIIR